MKLFSRSLLVLVLLAGILRGATLQDQSASPSPTPAPSPAASPAPSPDAPADKPTQVKVKAGIAEGLRTHSEEPEYPLLAQRAHLSGDVILHAIIDREGKVTNLRVLSGHPLLAQSALDAVRKWKYRPYVFEGKVVEVDTTITVRFHGRP